MNNFQGLPIDRYYRIKIQFDFKKLNKDLNPLEKELLNLCISNKDKKNGLKVRNLQGHQIKKPKETKKQTSNQNKMRNENKKTNGNEIKTENKPAIHHLNLKIQVREKKHDKLQEQPFRPSKRKQLYRKIDQLTKEYKILKNILKWITSKKKIISKKIFQNITFENIFFSDLFLYLNYVETELSFLQLKINEKQRKMDQMGIIFEMENSKKTKKKNKKIILTNKIKKFFVKHKSIIKTNIKQEIINLSLMLLCNNKNITSQALKILLENGADPDFHYHNTNMANTLMALCLNKNLNTQLLSILLNSIMSTTQKKQDQKENVNIKKEKKNEKKTKLNTKLEEIQKLKDKNGFQAIHYLCKNKNITENLIDLLLSSINFFDFNTLEIYCLNKNIKIPIIMKIFHKCRDLGEHTLYKGDINNIIKFLMHMNFHKIKSGHFDKIQCKYFFLRNLLFYNTKECKRLFQISKFKYHYYLIYKMDYERFSDKFIIELCKDENLNSKDFQFFYCIISKISEGDDEWYMIQKDILYHLFKRDNFNMEFLRTTGYLGCYSLDEKVTSSRILLYDLIENKNFELTMINFIIETIKKEDGYGDSTKLRDHLIKLCCKKFKNLKLVRQLLLIKSSSKTLFNTPQISIFKRLINTQHTRNSQNTLFHYMVKYLTFKTIRDCEVIFFIIYFYQANPNLKNQKNQSVKDLILLKNISECPQKNLILEILNMNPNHDQAFENDFLNYFQNGKFPKNHLNINAIPIHKEILELRTGMGFYLIKHILEKGIRKKLINDGDLIIFFEFLYSIKKNNYLCEYIKKKNLQKKRGKERRRKKKRKKKKRKNKKIKNLKKKRDHSKLIDQNKKSKIDCIEKILNMLNLGADELIPLKKAIKNSWFDVSSKDFKIIILNKSQKEKIKNQKKKKKHSKLISIDLHKFLLTIRSQTINNMFLAIQDEDIKQIKDYSKSSYQAFYYFIKYLYFNKLQVEDYEKIFHNNVKLEYNDIGSNSDKKGKSKDIRKKKSKNEKMNDISNKKINNNIVEEICYLLDYFNINPRCGLKFDLLFPDYIKTQIKFKLWKKKNK
ncbi:transcription initiation factor tfiid subunit 3 [Anaeramoeba flamelloides]|uniref:Transcription initiation factor tfiid subunit 3 n=1 Tax=Anaeramoeba flamelloides TaxID=1746091 RepID=A0ABQ8Y1Y4_9EUKA|nr:transcription initiation factor tfiid subunit 3 [Anaeramoeba flamelloides]